MTTNDAEHPESAHSTIAYYERPCLLQTGEFGFEFLIVLIDETTHVDASDLIVNSDQSCFGGAKPSPRQRQARRFPKNRRVASDAYDERRAMNEVPETTDGPRRGVAEGKATWSESSQEADRHAVIDVLNRYAEALDHRDWALLDDVFLADATADYGAGALTGREAIVRSIAGLLGGCGPSQHLLGNYQVAVDGDRARSTCRIRVFHQGAGTNASLEPFECFGEYRDDMRRGTSGWRIVHREMVTTIARGDPGVLGPAPM